jgi:CRP-like cAMP-binding protein
MDQTTVEALRSSPFFEGLDDEDLERIAEVGEPVSFGKAETIMEKGSSGDAMYVLLWGKTELAAGGRVHNPGAGEVVGEMALFSKKNRTATVTTVEPVEALKIPADRFHAFLLQNPTVAVGILEQVVERLREVQNRVEAYWS